MSSLRELEAMVEDMAKLQLTTNVQHKELWAMATKTFVMKADLALVAAVRAAGKH